MNLEDKMKPTPQSTKAIIARMKGEIDYADLTGIVDNDRLNLINYYEARLKKARCPLRRKCFNLKLYKEL